MRTYTRARARDCISAQVYVWTLAQSSFAAKSVGTQTPLVLYYKRTYYISVLTRYTFIQHAYKTQDMSQHIIEVPSCQITIHL